VADEARGTEGGVRLAYGEAAVFSSWVLEPVGPGLYLLKAEVARSRPAWLAFAPLTVWIHRGSLRWEWTTDEVSVVDRRFEAMLAEPRLGPRGG